MGDPPRRVVKRMLRSVVAGGSGCEYLALYDMNHPSPERRAKFLAKVEANFAKW